jgi:hypothetical protein
MTDFTFTGKNLTRSYIRAEADRQARYTIGFVLVIAAIFIVPAVVLQVPRVMGVLMEVGQ